MTAVEFLVEQFSKHYAIHQLEDEINKAKEMERNQIMDAYIDRMDCTSKEEMRRILGGEYYNKTYKQELEKL